MLGIGVWLAAAGAAAAQASPAAERAGEPDPPAVASLAELATLGGIAEERARLRNLLGRAPQSGGLIRSPSSASAPLASGGRRLAVALLAPELLSTWNSDLPFGFNDGSVWAGRGTSVRLMAGARAEIGPVTLILAPEWVYQENEAFQILPFTTSWDEGRDPLSSPWYVRPETVDLPSRFGEGTYAALLPGQSSLSVAAGPVVVGAATENLWWGPAIRNAVVMSNHAPGIPHLFVRTGPPLSTPVGHLEGRWILGRLQESDYFDRDPDNDVRSLSALALVFRPALEPDLSVGFARAVFAPAPDGIPAVAALDVLRNIGRPNARASDDLLREPGPDQVFSLFGRWLFPSAGLEAYAEWARYEQPASLRDFLLLPNHSQGYTLGLQWARPVAASSAVRLQAEATYLEPSPSDPHRRTIGWYTSRPVAQGYTHRGQVIGAGIGPASSSQWIAADFFAGDRSRLGVFGGRIRWDSYAFHNDVVPNPFYAHDVSVFVGVRAAHRVLGMDVAAELSTGERLNYLYQIDFRDWDDFDAVDIRNHSLRLSITPRLERR